MFNLNIAKMLPVSVEVAVRISLQPNILHCFVSQPVATKLSYQQSDKPCSIVSQRKRLEFMRILCGTMQRVRINEILPRSAIQPCD